MKSSYDQVARHRVTQLSDAKAGAKPGAWTSYFTISSCLLIASCIRLFLLVYGVYQDAVMTVKYTDIDYIVFTDASRFMTEGLSPYRRATYRYTPLLAWLLQGNIFISDLFGKTLFALCDIAVGYVIYKYILLKFAADKRTAVICSCLWLFNPIPMTVSTRGNAEPILAILVLMTLHMLSDLGRIHTVVSAVMFGISIHMKIYPATYALIIFMHVNEQQLKKTLTDSSKSYLHIRCLLPSMSGVIYGLISLAAFSVATGFCYKWYGDEFIQSAYTYHLTRQDIKHNFSPYFYMLYLVGDSAGILGVVMFAPQLILMLVIAYKYHSDVAFACFLQTFTFVTFNKVCTSQYFLWYLCLLPLTIPRLKMDWMRDGIFLGLLWLAGQGLWLFPAYLLEFHGCDTFIYIWLAGLVFFGINVYILYRLLTAYAPSQSHQT